MDTDLFFVSLGLTTVVVGGAMAYLRGTTRRLLRELCDSDAGAAFWLRSTDVLAMCGSLILVPAFGGLRNGAAWTDQLRLVIGLALAGIFVSVIFVASSVRGATLRAQTTPTAPAAPAGEPGGAGARA
ncbi:hypothetical protein [Aquabacterium humicola]|uniref:hypothetical protein n=1 Tax=Aquabacterium humicola TaxID=3237377 RepID=UPI002542FECC|nr:hypothetical protein [Rubrivivax pictus]